MLLNAQTQAPFEQRAEAAGPGSNTAELRAASPHLHEVHSWHEILHLLDQLHLVSGLHLRQPDGEMSFLFLERDHLLLLLGAAGAR